MALHRPDLYAQARIMLKESHDAMRREGVVSYFVAGEDAEDAALIPGSIVARMRQAEPGESLDQYVRTAIRDRGATSLFDDRRFVRFEDARVQKFDGGSATMVTIVYFTPVPGTYRRKGLELTGSFGYPIDFDDSDERVAAIRSALDLCVSTLRWTSCA